MNIRSWISLRFSLLVLLWAIPVLFYILLGMVALYQTGWLWFVALSLPFVWLTAWLVGLLWKPPKLNDTARGSLLEAPQFWTPQDAAAIAVVEQYRAEAVDVDRETVTNSDRYMQDAQTLAKRLSEHYHGEQINQPFQPLTMIEILAVIRLAVEDLEQWMLQNVPGSHLATIGHLSRLPEVAKALDNVQKVAYLVSTLFNPAKILAYPLWRKSTSITIEIQNEMIRGFYQSYLSFVGYYLIEMYSGRLKGGSKQYRERFGSMAMAIQAANGKLDQLSSSVDVTTSIAVMGQVKAGKSSLINALIGDHLASTGLLPETRQVQRYEYPIPGSTNVVTLLDTPGYDEADVSKKQLREITTASEAADLILLVLAANVSARQADLAMMKQLDQHYRDHPQLKPPVIIAVLTHIDLLRPVREWSPPYDWQNPHELKEQSIANAVTYLRELFGERISGFACVYTGSTHASDTSVADEVVPQLVEHLSQGKMSAILKAFYKQLSSKRFERLLKQTGGFLKQIGSSFNA